MTRNAQPIMTLRKWIPPDTIGVYRHTSAAKIPYLRSLVHKPIGDWVHPGDMMVVDDEAPTASGVRLGPRVDPRHKAGDMDADVHRHNGKASPRTRFGLDRIGQYTS